MSYTPATPLVPETYPNGNGHSDATVIDRLSKYPVYRIFFKGTNTPVDIMTSSVWSLVRHKGFRAGQGLEKGYYQKAGHMTSLHFAGNRHPWNRLITPKPHVANQESVSASELSNSHSTLLDNYMPIENIAAVFHRNIVVGETATYGGISSTFPKVKNSNAYTVTLKGGQSFDVQAGGWVVTRQPSVRMIKADGNFDTVEKIIRPNKPLVYFYAYGGQNYTGELHNGTTSSNSAYPNNTQSYEYALRGGLAPTRVGHFNSTLQVGSVTGNYNEATADTSIGNPLSIDTGATYLPFENVLSITQKNSGDSSINPANTTWTSNTSNLAANQTLVRDDDNNTKPLFDGEKYTDIFQPASVGSSVILQNETGN